MRENTLDAYIARLRRKLRGLEGAPAITTVHGVGYRDPMKRTSASAARLLFVVRLDGRA